MEILLVKNLQYKRKLRAYEELFSEEQTIPIEKKVETIVSKEKNIENKSETKVSVEDKTQGK